ncbi:hypothetical protein [Tenacibaculum finnmarkense]|uniref:hypothetical protein n=1 Tax=Tenacibaculum finnmarkense TaxID=2781243 RepID=UPI001E438B66|nr:hypothetical protein [Tenacibaculum finnmarkense]MCD8413656.1 hypothetical protein [Tenacibaculum finnmarkense genomovar ulcerans]
MKKSNRFFTYFIIFSLVYILIYMLFDEAILYLIGGLIGSFLKIFLVHASPILIGLFWFFFIGLLIYLLNLTKNNFKFLLIILIGFSLYFLDFIMYSFLVEGYNSEILKYLVAIVKGLVLSLICYNFLKINTK